MSRYDELKALMAEAGGYTSLGKEEQKEYSAILKERKGEVEAPKEDLGEQTVTVKYSEIQKMIDQAVAGYKEKKDVKNGKLFNKWVDFEEVDGGFKTATLKVYRKDSKAEPMLIVRMDYLKVIFNDETRKYDKILYAVGLLDAKNNETEIELDSDVIKKIKELEKVQLIDVDRKKQVKDDGVIRVTPKDKEGYVLRNANDTLDGVGKGGYEVPLRSVRYQETFTCRRKSGKEFKIVGRHLNN